MSESLILYAGIFCFAMILLGVTLTIQEFRREAQVRAKSSVDTQRVKTFGQI